MSSRCHTGTALRPACGPATWRRAVVIWTASRARQWEPALALCVPAPVSRVACRDSKGPPTRGLAGGDWFCPERPSHPLRPLQPGERSGWRASKPMTDQISASVPAGTRAHRSAPGSCLVNARPRGAPWSALPYPFRSPARLLGGHPVAHVDALVGGRHGEGRVTAGSAPDVARHGGDRAGCSCRHAHKCRPAM